MTERPADLPDFERPPVVEVAIAVAFEPLESMRQAHLGRFWDAIRAEYPKTADRPPVELQPEVLDDHNPPQVTFRIVQAPTISRAWFLTEDEHRLIQIQRDRLTHNWRGRGDDYPRFEALSTSFNAHLNAFASLVEAEDLGDLRPIQVEVVYINDLGPEDLAASLTVLNQPESPGFGVAPDPLTISYRARFDVREGDTRTGRIEVDARSVVDNNTEPPSVTNRLTLTYRAPTGGRQADALDHLIEQGRQAIVALFTSLTTRDRHTEWERTQ